MTLVTIEVPDNISEPELRLVTALKLFELGRLSMGQAARMTGYSKTAFLEVAGNYGVSVFNYSDEELDAEADL